MADSHTDGRADGDQVEVPAAESVHAESANAESAANAAPAGAAPARAAPHTAAPGTTASAGAASDPAAAADPANSDSAASDPAESADSAAFDLAHSAAADVSADSVSADSAARLAAALDECQARQLRTLADFDNYRRRTARELDHARSAERDRLVAEWIPVVDDLDRALAHAAADPATLVDGVRGVREAAVAALRRAGVNRVDEVTGPFDPTQHEVGAVVADPQTPAGDVVDVLLPGYEAEDGRVLRPAAVAVSGGQGNGDQQRP